MVTFSEISTHLQDVLYRPGWSITVHQGAYEGPQLIIFAKVQDSTHPEKLVPLDIHVPLPPFRDLLAFDEWLLWRLQRVEAHEAMEWLRLKGRPIFDPHRPQADRDEPIVALPTPTDPGTQGIGGMVARQLGVESYVLT